MAGVSDNDLKTLQGWPRGINNLSDENELKPNELVLAINVDLDRQGKPKRRKGYTNIAAAPAHSAYGTPFGLLCVIGGVLKLFDANMSAATLDANFGVRPASFDTIANTVYWTNGVRIGRISADHVMRPVWVESPGQPDVAPYGVGSLPAGEYQVATTSLDASKRESGSSLATLVTLDSPGGIHVSNIPFSADAETTRIYLSPTNGDGLYGAVDIPAGMTSYILGALPTGKLIETQWHTRMPPGQIIRAYNARTLVAAGNILWHSDAFRHGLKLPGAYTRYNNYITMVRPVGEADTSCVYVAVNGEGGDKPGRTYALTGTGDPKTWKRVIAYPFGAIEGTDAVAPGSYFDPALGATPVGYWIAENGVPCIGLPSGQVRPLTESRFVTPFAERGATLLRHGDGVKQMLSSLVGSTPNSAAAFGDFASATVYRNGVALP